MLEMEKTENNRNDEQFKEQKRVLVREIKALRGTLKQCTQENDDIRKQLMTIAKTLNSLAIVR